MFKKSFLELLFKGFSIERWNDKLRPWQLMHIDKHAHKMMIAYCIGKLEEDAGNQFSWTDVIKGGVFELIRRTVISDIQSPVFKEISKNHTLVSKLNGVIFMEIQSFFNNPKMKEEFSRYLREPDYLHPHSKRILDAAHKYSSYWEFQLIRNANPEGYMIKEIEIHLGNEIDSYSDLEGIKRLTKRHNLKNFVDLVGEMRYQIRWGHLPRIPKTSVLGHVMLVASLSYFMTMELHNPCDKRIYNNFFAALFHDLPEAVTRDIIKPVKRSVPGMEEEIKRIEKKLAEDEIYPNLEASWIPEIQFFTQQEFHPKIMDGKIVKHNEISEFYNEDRFNPYDGSMVKCCDDFAAFLEAYSSINFGIHSIELEQAMKSIKERYKEKVVAGLYIYELFDVFDK